MLPSDRFSISSLPISVLNLNIPGGGLLGLSAVEPDGGTIW